MGQEHCSVGRGAEQSPAIATWPTLGYGTLPIRRILVVQTQRLGDVLCATPVFTALRRQFPHAHLAALVHRPSDVILRDHPDLDAVMAYDRQTTHRSLRSRLQLIGELREHRFDWVLTIHAASSVALALWQAGIPWRTCVWRYGERKKPHWWRLYHQHIRQDRLQGTQHEIEHNLDVLRELGMEPRHDGYRIAIRPDEQADVSGKLAALGRDVGRRLALIHPGHGGGRQAWAPESYAAVADGLAARGLQVGITGSSAEEALAARVIGSMRQPALNLAGRFSLREFAAVLGQAGLFISVSTGPMHLASAMRVPAVTLYGPSDLRIEQTRFCPYGSLSRAVLSPRPCVCTASRTCEQPVCMTAITPELVLQAADALLSAGA